VTYKTIQPSKASISIANLNLNDLKQEIFCHQLSANNSELRIAWSRTEAKRYGDSCFWSHSSFARHRVAHSSD
jgi:hypothetical protein